MHGLVGTEEPIVPVFELKLDLSHLAPTVLDRILTSSSFGSGHTDYHSFVEYQTFKPHSTQAHDAAYDILQDTGNFMCSYITIPFLLVLEDPMEHDSQPHR